MCQILPQPRQVRRPDSRRITSSSSTTSSSTRSRPTPRSASSLSSADACGTVRGNPSSRKPSAASGSASRSRTMLIVTSSGTSWPESMYRLASFPSGVPCWTLARKMSPVEIFGTDRCEAMNSACVPLPAPGGPTSTSLMGSPPSARILPYARLTAACAARGLPEEPFVVALHELALDLLHSLQADTDDDQYGGATEGEVLLLAADQVDEQVRQDRDDAQVQRAGER